MPTNPKTPVLSEVHAEIAGSRKATGRKDVPCQNDLIALVKDTYGTARAVAKALHENSDETVLARLYGHPKIVANAKAWDQIDHVHMGRLLIAACHGLIDQAIADARNVLQSLKKIKATTVNRKRLNARIAA